jgi:hypothetical protein
MAAADSMHNNMEGEGGTRRSEEREERWGGIKQLSGKKINGKRGRKGKKVIERHAKA